MKRFIWPAAVVAPLLMLAACSSNDDTPSSPPITQAVPASAGNSPQEFISAVRQIVAADADMLEPSDISAVVASTTTTDDTKEPEAL